ncbi:glycosyltransferase family 4 protein [Stakelama saccharophila]|uniref:Glycosyltransferase family 4 protein n=1 Tax=Stakelama saccharophila TaxID=3075605 RepID=A0ABZ0BAU2_9SPHN|nr:glycosyltransferase family 4 protein [Stakelama sp. W311]WNO54196.1 glycosyltransferase family 4 protein [Stakelama sp. W311]
MAEFVAIRPVSAGPAPRRICFVIAALGAGGAERIVSWLAEHWIAGGAEVTVIAFDHADEPVFHDFPERARFIRLGIAARGDGRMTPAPLRRIAALRTTLKAVAPDLVVSFLTKVNMLTLCASIRLPARVVVAERNNPRRQPAHWLWKVVLHRAYARADAIVCQTASSVVCIPPRYRDRVRVIANPVAPYGAARTAKRAGRTVVGVGRLEYQKGFDLLIDAFALVAGRHPDWQLDLWGAGPCEAGLQERAAGHGLADRVAFRGVSRRPGGWIAETGIFVLASRYEGFPNVLGEAMAAGLPVIAADCDFGPSELVTDGVDGLLVGCENVEALADALARMMAEPGLRNRLAAAAPGVAERFAPERIAAEWDMMVAATLV